MAGKTIPFGSPPIAPVQKKATIPFGSPPPAKKAFRFAVDTVEPTREEKLAKLQQEAQVAKAESDKQNSIDGFAQNFGGEVIKTFASSPVALGKTIAKVSQDPTKIADIGGKLESSQIQLLHLIREKDKRGEDSTKLKRLFNQNSDQVDEIKREVNKYSADLPTDLELAGQVGGTALDILSAGTYGRVAKDVSLLTTKGIPLGAKIPGLLSGSFSQAATGILPTAAKTLTPLSKATGLFSKTGASRIAQGAGLGYAYDVTGGLQGTRGEDRKGANALIPGLGMAIGAGIPLALEGERSAIGAIKSNFSKEGRIASLEAKRLKALQQLPQAPLAKAVEKGKQRGIDVQKVLSETDVLHGAVDKSGRITTKGEDGAVAQYTLEKINGNEALVSDALKKEGRSISPETVRAKLTRAINNSGIEGAELKSALGKIGDEIDGLGLRAGESGAIPLETIHRAKIDKYSDINFNTEASTSKYKKAIAKALKELVEENTTSVAVNDINKELSKHFAVIDYLNKLDGKVVKGGKLGKYFSQTVGAIVGAHFGPLGSIAGAEAGGRIRGETMSRVFGGKTGKTTPEAAAITQAKDFINAEPLALPKASVVPKPVINLPARAQSTIDAQEVARIQAQLPQSSNNLGSRNISQTTTIAPTIKPILDTISRHFQEAGDVVDNLPPEEIDRLGGMPALLESTKTDIVRGLTAEGKDDAAKVIEALPTSSISTLKELQSAISDAVQGAVSVADRAKKKYADNPDALLKQYLQENGNIVNTDEARKLFSDVGYIGSNSAAVQEPAKKVADAAFDYHLSNAKKGQDAYFLAGGSGAGKSTATKSLKGSMDKAAFVFDGNLSSYESAKKKIGRAEERGLNITVPYIYRNPVDAWNNGVIARMLASKTDLGRVVPLKEFLENTVGALSTVKKLIDDGIPVVGFKTVENASHVNMPISEIEKLSTPENLKETLVKQTTALYKEGKISKEQYDALMEDVDIIK